LQKAEPEGDRPNARNLREPVEGYSRKLQAYAHRAAANSFRFLSRLPYQLGKAAR